MRRRALIEGIGGAVLLTPHYVHAQPSAVPIVGYLSSGSAGSSARWLPHFGDGLKESGYIEDRNVSIARRWAEGQDERLPILASELVALKVAVLAAFGSIAAQAALRSTQTIPIVFLSGDPVALGLVTSFSRPPGNATGINVLAPEMVAKRLELLHELIPSARSVAFLVNAGNPIAASQLAGAQAAARITGHSLQIAEARTGSEIEQAFARLVELRPDALLIATDPLFVAQRDQIVALAQRYRLPAIYDFPEYAATGGLVSYGPSNSEAIRLVGVYVGKILKGARPGDLPVQHPTRFELIINLRTAKALDLTIPSAILARADELIE